MRGGGLVVVVLLGALAACGAPAEVAAPSAVPVTSAPTVAASPTQAPLIVLPPRPRDIDLSAVPSCELLTKQQRDALQLDQPWVSRPFTSAFYGNTSVRHCSVRSQDRGVVVALLLSDKVGMEAWTMHAVNSDVEPGSVNGFPAVVAGPAKGTSGYCTVAVDVGPHDVLDAQVAVIGTDDSISEKQLCDGAQQVAEFAMTTLVDTAGR